MHSQSSGAAAGELESRGSWRGRVDLLGCRARSLAKWMLVGFISTLVIGTVPYGLLRLIL